MLSFITTLCENVS